MLQMSWSNLIKQVNGGEYDEYRLREFAHEIHAVTDLGSTAMHFAVIAGCLESVKYLHGIDPTKIYQENCFGETPLHWACKAPDSSDIVQFLINHCATIFERDTDGNTPLHWAAEYDRADLLPFFLTAETKVLLELKNFNDESPLDLARYHSSAEFLRYLREVKL